MAECKRDNQAREALAVAGDCVDGAGSQLTEHSKTLDELREFLKVIVDSAVELGSLGQRYYETRFARVEVTEIVDLGEVVFALAGDGSVCNREELVRRLAHRRDDHDGVALLARLDDGGDAFNGGG